MPRHLHPLTVDIPQGLSPVSPESIRLLRMPQRSPHGRRLRLARNPLPDRFSSVQFLNGHVAISRYTLEILAYLGGPGRSRLMAGKWKVVYQSLSARSDLSNGEVVLRFYFSRNFVIFVLRGISGPGGDPEGGILARGHKLH